MEETTRPRRTSGAGSLFQEKTGRRLWRGAYIITDPSTQRPIRKYVSGHTPAEANRRLKDAIADSRRETAAADSPTVAWWAERWLDTVVHRIRPATFRSYQKVIRSHVIPALGSWPLADLRPGDVERWTAGLAERGLRPSTVALSRRVLAACLADAERDGRAPRNAARLAHAPRVEGTTRRRALTTAEARSLLELAKTDADAGLLVTLALGTGARVGELLGLEWSDVDLSAGTVSIARSRSRGGVGPTKSRRGVRTVALPAFAIKALTAQERRSGPVVATTGGLPLIPERAGERWRRLRERAGLDGLRFHDLRGTYATLALAAGVPAKALADVLGHDPAVLLRSYAGPIENGREAIASAIGEALG
jgi:integrase